MQSNAKLLVVGATGYIGTPLFRQAQAFFDVTGTSSTSASSELLYLDLAQPAEFDFDTLDEKTYVVMTAAISAPDVCANEYQRANRINVEGTSEFIAQALSRGCKVVFFSSDTVYGERESPTDESAEVAPLGEYALMKHAVETRFRGHSAFKSLRLSYVFSRDDKFTQFLVSAADRKKTVQLFHPFLRAIVHRQDVVESVLALVKNWSSFAHGIVNIGGPELCSRIDFAEVIRDIGASGLTYEQVVPPESFFEKRPRVINMESSLLRALLGRQPRTLRQAAMIEFERA